ncbi:hypothetical protein PV02_07345 [Methanolobus chelungpuianus]|uniref:Uncharacterized protein n=1 Tax=Methanolobus chelungpuianus TaxID=502115 RepID=A0AAE3HB51_9EURY|nr:hypothetical protein [Methanolobus chelungpuianus]
MDSTAYIRFNAIFKTACRCQPSRAEETEVLSATEKIRHLTLRMHGIINMQAGKGNCGYIEHCDPSSCQGMEYV